MFKYDGFFLLNVLMKSGLNSIISSFSDLPHSDSDLAVNLISATL
jgi:hypothetical protein